MNNEEVTKDRRYTYIRGFRSLRRNKWCFKDHGSFHGWMYPTGESLIKNQLNE